MAAISSLNSTFYFMKKTVLVVIITASRMSVKSVCADFD